jgi:hypothetical protein
MSLFDTNGMLLMEQDNVRLCPEFQVFCAWYRECRTTVLAVLLSSYSLIWRLSAADGPLLVTRTQFIPAAQHADIHSG